jgi:hypothetical protein
MADALLAQLVVEAVTQQEAPAAELSQLLAEAVSLFNTAPHVEAGVDQTVPAVDGAHLVGTATDDGNPNPPGALTYAWSKVSGPGTVTFSAGDALETDVVFSVPGTYVLRLTADDSALTGSDDVTITAEATTALVSQLLVEAVTRPAEHAFDGDRDVTGETVGLTWIEHRDNVGDPHVSSKTPLPDPSTYYGGWKEPDIVKWGLIRRALSDSKGAYESAEFTWQHSDTERVWRGLLADDVAGLMLNDSVVIRMVSDAARRLGGFARTVARGFIRSYKPSSPLLFDFTASDWLTRILTIAIPQRRLSRTQFPDLPTEAADQPEPIIYGAMSDEGSASGPVSGVTAAPQAFGSAVTGVTATPSGSGGSLPGGKVFGFQLSALGDNGVEYDLSASVPATTPGGSSQLERANAIPAPTYQGDANIGMPGDPGGAPLFSKFRWTRLTALKQIDGVWKESAPSAWGAVRGDLYLLTIGGAYYSIDPDADIERVRMYVFNLNDFSTVGWDPVYDPAPAIGVPGDTVRLVRIVEADATDPYTIRSAQVHPEWGSHGNVTNPLSPHYGQQWLSCAGDTDGDDFIEDGASGSVAIAWDTWTPPAGVTLAGYRVYYTTPSEQVRRVEIAAGTTTYTLADEFAGALTDGRTFSYAVTATCPDGETTVSLPATATTPAKSILAPIEVGWVPLPAATAYHVYRRGAGAEYDRRWTATADVTRFVDDLLDTGVTFVSGIPGGVGVVPARYVGTEMIDGASWSVFLLAGHAVSEVVSCFSKGIRVAEPRYGVDWLVPGRTGWPFGTLYREFGGRWYTVIYLHGLDADDAISGTRPITCNVHGIEDQGDGGGALITRSLLQYKHFLQNFVFNNWQLGAWLEPPAFPADPAPEAGDVLHVMDATSFETADALSAVRLAGGYVGATMIGAGSEYITVRDMLARWNQSCDVDGGFNRRLQYSVWMEDDDPGLLTTAPEYSQERDIIAGSFDIEDVDTELFNDRPYTYGYRPADGSWAVQDHLPDAVSIAALRETRTADVVNLYMVRLAAVAEDIVARLLARSAPQHKVPRNVVWKVALAGLNSELASVGLVTHADGIGPDGWTKHPVRIRSHELDPEDFSVTLRGRDVGYLFDVPMES